MKYGSLFLAPLFDGHGCECARDVLLRSSADGDPWDEHSDLLNEHGNLELAVGGYLIRTGDRTVLVDAGVGTIDNGRYRGGQFLENLKLHGVEPEDVTDVVFTHLHFDHVGWATKKGEVVFQNATYRVHQRDWEHFVESPTAEPGAVRKLSPIANRLELFSQDGPIAPGIDVKQTTGHTPGSTTFIVSGGGRQAALIGDLAHTPVELETPDWHFYFDFDRDAATAARNHFVEEFVDTDTDIFASHFPGMRAGRLTRSAGVTKWTYS